MQIHCPECGYEGSTITGLFRGICIALAALTARITIFAQNQLERDNRRLMAEAEKSRKTSMQVTGDDVEKARITAKMIRGIRAKLGLSQADLAGLLNVNSQTVYQWEHKEGRLTFRGSVKPAILEVRMMTKQEARKRFEALQEKAKRKTPKKRKKR